MAVQLKKIRFTMDNVEYEIQAGDEKQDKVISAALNLIYSNIIWQDE